MTDVPVTEETEINYDDDCDSEEEVCNSSGRQLRNPQGREDGEEKKVDREREEKRRVGSGSDRLKLECLR